MDLLLRGFCILLASSQLIAAAVVVDDFSPDEENLKQWLFVNCNLGANSRPVPKFSEPINVHMHVIPYTFRGLEDSTQIFSLLIEVDFEWKHPCAVWGHSNDTKQWAAVSRIQEFADLFWHVTVNLVNAADDASLFETEAGKTPLYIYQDGTFIWQVVTVLSTYCSLNLKAWPFDQQSCGIFIESFDETSLVKISLDGSGVMVEGNSMQFTSSSSLWSLSSVSASIANVTYFGWDDAVYNRAIFMFILQRRYGIYIANLLLPCFCLTILQLVSIFLPPETSARPSYSVTVLLAFTVMMSVVSDSIPKSSEIPYITLLLAIQVFIGILCSIYTVSACALAREKSLQNWASIRLLKACLPCLTAIRILDCMVYFLILLGTVATNYYILNQMFNYLR